MPSRRSTLAATGAVAATALAGCSAFGTPEGSSAEIRPDRNLQPEDGEVVARATTEHIGCPQGTVEIRAEVSELSDKVLQTLTNVDVVPGQSECESDWTHDGVHVTQAWRDLGPEPNSAISDTASNVVYTDAGGNVRLENTSSTETGEWRVRRTDDGGEFQQYRFRSTYTADEPAGNNDALTSEGDELGDVTVEVPLATSGIFGRKSKTVTLMMSLVHGQIEEQG